MSLVAEVLASIKRRSGVEGSSASGDGISVEVADLAKRAGEAKVAVMQALEGQYDQLCTALQDTSILQTRVSNNMEQLQHLKKTLDTEVSPSVVHSVDAITGVAARLQQAEEGLAIAQQLLAVHEALRQAGDHNVAGRYFDAAKCLNKVDKMLTTINPDIEIVSSIVEEVVVQRTTVIYTLSQVWSKTFQWEEEDHQHEQKKTITLLIKNWEKAKQDPAVHSADEVSLPSDFVQVSSALSFLDELHLRMAVLSNNLMKNFFKVLVSRPARVSLKECGSCYALSITFSTSAVSKSSGRHLTQPSPYEVFTSSEQVLRCLHDTGFGAEFEGVEAGCPDGGTTTLMKLLGQQIGECFTSLVISECLAAAVPCSRKNLDQFDAVRDATEQFHAMLVSIGFYSESEKSILEYAANVDSVFSDRACAHLLDTARELIRQPLHNTVTIAEQDDHPPLVIQ
ncbi:RZZ complex subunit Zw10, partial [Trinorchestia longiramus]